MVRALQISVSVASPGAMIVNMPSQLTRNGTAEFSFDGDDGTASFQCQLYGSSSADGNYTDCTSPRSICHVFPPSSTKHSCKILANSVAGNPDPDAGCMCPAKSEPSLSHT